MDIGKQLRTRLDGLREWQVGCLIFGLGCAVFCTGLTGGFQGDDTFQIVTNVPVHSLANIGQFFNGGTFYNGSQLTGVYYRPLMTTTFSLIYTLFGAHPIAFHIVQLLLYLGGAFVFYLILNQFLKPLPALVLVLIFVVHPLNSQNVFAIPSMQDALFFLFGTLALWLLIKLQSMRSMVLAAGCLFLALLAKEAAVVFVVLACLYLCLFDRSRLKTFAGIMIVPIALWLALKANAVGLIGHNPAAGPIDSLNLLERLYTVPSLITFYVSKLVFPAQQANNYYWTHTRFSMQGVGLPLLIDLALVALFVYFGVRVRRQLDHISFLTYLFFVTWMILGLGLYMQIIPLDMTACEGWFYLPMAGLLGAIGIALQTVRVRLPPSLVAVFVIVVIAALGIRTAVRGVDYHNQYTLAMHDVYASPDDYFAMNNLAQNLIDTSKFQEAAYYAKRSVSIYPAVGNYDNLGVALEQMGDYQGAISAYRQALRYGDMSIVYENLSLLLMVHSDPTSAEQFFQKALQSYPHNYKLWVYRALFDGSIGRTADAKTAIARAAQYGNVPPFIYSNIMADKPFTLPLLGKTVLVR